MKFPLAVKAVVIDLDGTLLNTASDLAYAASLMMTDLGREAPPFSTLETYIGNGVSRLVKRVLTGDMTAEPDSELFARGYALYEKHYSEHVSRESRPFEGVVAGLERLREMGMPLACITNKVARFTLPLLRDTGLLDFFPLVLSGDSLPKRKPDPLPLLHACQHFGIEPSQLLLIGDSLNDTQAARAAGCPVFCVPYGYNRGKPVAELNPDAVVPTLLAATELIVRAA
ncbi:MAG: phosphoglycolate phosphatase [Betaproteobacteria bacterium]|nr:phosphoglycolate phosphatase [Betaproteobacteria bacterium]